MDGTTTTLADTLLDDLDDLSESEDTVISDEGMEIEHEPVKGDILNDDTLHKDRMTTISLFQQTCTYLEFQQS
jgi:hypothetical protein